MIPSATDAPARELDVRAATFDQHGVFTIKNIAPGDYRLYSWQALPEDIWKSPQVETLLLDAAETAELIEKLGIE